MLGKIEKINIRDIWKHEAHDFTKWLAEDENIELLSTEIGIEINVIQREASVGSFSVDLFAEESNTGDKIIIENQLETTNHDHLGKIITYASGLEAKFIIWIFKKIKEEHRKAIDWLNEITDDDHNFFAIQMELWKIGESLPAPKFNLISSPNNWAKAIKKSKSNDNLSDGNIFQLDFWKEFAEYLTENKSSLKPRKPRAQHWYDFSIGNSQAHIAFIVSIKDDFIRIDYYIPNNKELFKKLYENKTAIEENLGFEMDWQELPQAKASRIAKRKDVIDIKEETVKKEAFDWYKKNGEKIAKIFSKYL